MYNYVKKGSNMFCKKEKMILKQMGFNYDVELREIKDYYFPEIVRKRTVKNLEIPEEEIEILELGLKLFFEILKNNMNENNENNEIIEMIDSKVDELWHNLLLDTKNYMFFCSNYVGKYIHHIPYDDKKILLKEEIEDLQNKYHKILINNKYYVKELIYLLNKYGEEKLKNFSYINVILKKDINKLKDLNEELKKKEKESHLENKNNFVNKNELLFFEINIEDLIDSFINGNHSSYHLNNSNDGTGNHNNSHSSHTSHDSNTSSGDHSSSTSSCGSSCGGGCGGGGCGGA